MTEKRGPSCYSNKIINSESEVREHLKDLGVILLKMKSWEREEFHHPTFLHCDSQLVNDARDIVNSIKEYDWRRNRRDSDWFTVYSGWRFWPNDPRPGDYNIEDIAQSLSGIQRFNAHTNCNYSVAHHCILMSDFADDEVKFLALMHDATEPYFCDLPTPIKKCLGDSYADLENKCWTAICQQYHINYSDADMKKLKKMDSLMLHSEAHLFFPPGHVASSNMYGGEMFDLPRLSEIYYSQNWTRSYTRELFIERFKRYAPKSLQQVWCHDGASPYRDQIGFSQS